MVTTDVRVLGVYDVPQNSEVRLVEVLVYARPSEIAVGQFVQEEPNTPRSSWQTAYMERYLNATGDAIIGDDIDLPNHDEAPTRLTFFLYYLDPSRPLLTPFGQADLPHPVSMPARLKSIIPFEDVD